MKTVLISTVVLLTSGACLTWARGAGPTDPQIAEIVVTANQVDMDAGKLATSKSTTTSQSLQKGGDVR
ncbi:MAG TPA: hypothetical protein VGI32_15240 [Steroidobacteraceae bacterium]|jgi:putative membrane protein